MEGHPGQLGGQTSRARWGLGPSIMHASSIWVHSGACHPCYTVEPQDSGQELEKASHSSIFGPGDGGFCMAMSWTHSASIPLESLLESVPRSAPWTPAARIHLSISSSDAQRCPQRSDAGGLQAGIGATVASEPHSAELTYS